MEKWRDEVKQNIVSFPSRAMTPWLWVDGTTPDNNAHFITLHKQTEMCGCEADPMFHSDRSEGDNHVITPARIGKKRNPRARCSETHGRLQRVFVWGCFDNETKINREQGTRDCGCVCKCESIKYMEMTVCHQESTLVWASAVEMFVIPERGACLDWDETEGKC